MCANNVVAGARFGTPLLNNRSQNTHQFAPAQQIDPV
jgi:hypothetical protein